MPAGGKTSGRRVFRVAVGIWLAAMVALSIGMAFVDVLFIFAAWPVLLALWLSLPVCAVVVTVGRLRRRDYRAAAFSALVPVIAFAVLWYGLDIGDFIRFQIERPRYEARIREAVQGSGPTEERDIFRVQVGPPTLAIFPWDGLFMNWTGVVYDATDTVSTGTAQQLPQQIPGSVANELAACLDGTSPLGGHFYIGHFHC